MSFFRRSQACFFDFVSAFSQPAGHYTPPLDLSGVRTAAQLTWQPPRCNAASSGTAGRSNRRHS